MKLVAVVWLACVAACGTPAPQAPRAPAFDPARLARELHVDLEQLAEIATRHEGRCGELLAALRPLVARMRAHAQEVATALEDPARGKQLRTEVRKYDAQHRGVGDAIGTSLGASYQACDRDPELLRVVDLIPVL